mgnify:CR=1 FL=1
MNTGKTLLTRWTLFILLAISALSLTSCRPSTEESDIGDTYDQSIKIVNTTHPAKIIVYGEPILFRDELRYFPAQTLTEDLFKDEIGQYERIVLIINDKSGTVSLSQEALELISGYVNAGKLDFYYFGTDKNDRIIQNGIWNGNLSEDDLSIVTALYGHTVSYFRGVWTTHDEAMNNLREENFGMVITLQIADCMRSNN